MMSIERNEYEIECLSPVHIGNGRKLQAFEYLYDGEAGTVYFVDKRKWTSFLVLIDDVAAHIQRVGGKSLFQGGNLWQWLVEKGISPDELRSLSATASRVTANKLERKSLNDIARNVVTAEGVPYIPGSSIKGALRTGILYGLIRRDPEKYRRYWREFADTVKKRPLKEVNSVVRKIVNQMEKDAFQRLTIPNTPGRRPPDAVRDVMRGLVVSDAHCLEQENESIIVQKIDVPATSYKETPLPIFRECIRPGTRLRCAVSMDTRMMEEINMSSLAEVLQMTKAFMQDGIRMQKAVFGSSYEREFAMAQDADMILGGGTGFLTKTILYALAPSVDEGRRITAQYLDMAFRKHGHVAEDTQISPRTVKLTCAGMEKSLMGLCYIHEVKSC